MRMLNRLKVIIGIFPYKLVGYWISQLAWSALFIFLYLIVVLNVLVFLLQLIGF
jgi:hypothetical protein